MKSRLFILFSFLFAGYASAQNMKIDIPTPSVNVRQDSTIVTLKMTVSVPDMNPLAHINLIPVLADGSRKVELPVVILNGKKAQAAYRRNQAILKRKKVPTPNTFAAYPIDEKQKVIVYRVAVPSEGWMSRGELSLRKEVMNSKNEKIQNEVISLKAQNIRSVAPRTEVVPADNSLTSTNFSQSAGPSVPQAVPQTGKNFKGSFISPESDATDERNQKELNFSLDEARVIAEVNPQMLSLRELYTVALSYKNTPAQFYKIIEISVKNYPASPVANLNAAAAAIELGDVYAAGRYLQMASHKEIAYMNCRGVYELLSNNTYEGIRLLKAAKAAGSEEAAQNLKIFFEMNQQPE